MPFSKYLKDKKGIFEKYVKYIFSEISSNIPAELQQAMEYSLFAGGKRLRPILVYAVNEIFEGAVSNALTVGSAIEIIHTYSLIHDDLPAMDNDDFRRGKPTNHKVFGEAMAILAGDALLTEAFNILTNMKFYKKVSYDTIIDISNFISRAAGASGMVGGQVYDLIYENRDISSEDVEKIHIHKTAKLITASIYSGARLNINNDNILRKLINFGEKIGLAFQIVDDILDIEGDFQQLGKSIGKDSAQNKATYPHVFGIQRSKEIAEELISKAVESIEFLEDKGNILKQLSQFILNRVY